MSEEPNFSDPTDPRRFGRSGNYSTRGKAGMDYDKEAEDTAYNEYLKSQGFSTGIGGKRPPLGTRDTWRAEREKTRAKSKGQKEAVKTMPIIKPPPSDKKPEDEDVTLFKK